jgi:1-acyl-sn-glycerol-3-phosphate acyltransferase
MRDCNRASRPLGAVPPVGRWRAPSVVLGCCPVVATDYAEAEQLSPRERRLIAVCQHINERPAAKRLQTLFHRAFSMRWIALCMHNLLDEQGLDRVAALRPPRGVLVCSNHRTFFDMYVVFTLLRNKRIPWVRDVFFPVRSPFFYDSWVGLGLNLIMGGGAMYPPIFREPAKLPLNKLSVQRIVDFLQKPGVVIGMHPEGTRGKGPDPYELLPAQPGVGQMALQANATVLPVWISGLSNDLPRQVLSNYRRGEHRGDPIVVRFGEPVDLSDLRAQRARVTVYKRAADRILDAIRDLAV